MDSIVSEEEIQQNRDSILSEEVIQQKTDSIVSEQEICKYFNVGKCKRGENCHFLHDPNLQGQEITEQQDDSDLVNSDEITCKFFLKNKCRRGKRCFFRHDQNEKTSMEDVNDENSPDMKGEPNVKTGDNLNNQSDVGNPNVKEDVNSPEIKVETNTSMDSWSIEDEVSKLKPDSKGTYSLRVARPPDNDATFPKNVAKSCRKFGRLADFSLKEKFIFIKYNNKEDASNALKGLCSNFKVGVHIDESQGQPEGGQPDKPNSQTFQSKLQEHETNMSGMTQTKKLWKQPKGKQKSKQEPFGQNVEAAENSDNQFYCDVCNVDCPNSKAYKAHIRGMKHTQNLMEPAKEGQPYRPDSQTFKRRNFTVRPISDNRDKGGQPYQPDSQTFKSKNFIVRPISDNRDKEYLNQSRYDDTYDDRVVDDSEPTKELMHSKLAYDLLQIEERENLYCDLCQYSCPTPELYKSHVAGVLHVQKMKQQEKEKQKPKQEPSAQNVEAAENSDNQFYCAVCKIDCPNSKAYQTHIRGLTHTQTLMEQGKGNYENPQPDPEYEEQRKKEGCFKSNLGEFTCEICSCRMTGSKAFEAHMTGARHKKNVKNRGIGGTHQVSSLKPDIPGVARVQEKLDKHDQGCLIGLQHITEYVIQTAGKPCDVKYICNLCEKKCDVNTIIPHVTGSKHRLQYIKEQYMNYYTILRQEKTRKSELTEVLDQYASEIERDEGRQKVKVKNIKNTELSSITAKAVKKEADATEDVRRKRPPTGAIVYSELDALGMSDTIKKQKMTDRESNSTQSKPDYDTYRQDEYNQYPEDYDSYSTSKSDQNRTYYNDNKNSYGENMTSYSQYGGSGDNTNQYDRSYNYSNPNYGSGGNYSESQYYNQYGGGGYSDGSYPSNSYNQESTDGYYSQGQYNPNSYGYQDGYQGSYSNNSQSTAQGMPSGNYNTDYSYGNTGYNSYDNKPSTSAENTHNTEKPSKNTEPSKKPDESTSNNPIAGIIGNLSQCLVNTEEEAAMALQVSNALTQALIHYRVSNQDELQENYLKSQDGKDE